MKSDELKIKNGIEPLEQMLAGTEDQKEQANINYELQIMNDELGKPERADKHRQAALEMYQKLYEKTPKSEYKQRIEELSN